MRGTKLALGSSCFSGSVKGNGQGLARCTKVPKLHYKGVSLSLGLAFRDFASEGYHLFFLSSQPPGNGVTSSLYIRSYLFVAFVISLFPGSLPLLRHVSTFKTHTTITNLTSLLHHHQTPHLPLLCSGRPRALGSPSAHLFSASLERRRV